MADQDLSSPLLQSPRSNHSEVIITVPDDDDYDSCRQPLDQPGNHQSYVLNHHSRTCDLGNPYEFLGSGSLSVPGPATVNPFKNDTPDVDGVYEVLKILVCLPIALARLVLFGLALLVGYIATKLALEGWKDRHNPMPKWRCRIMWVTRLCTRSILFSFGYHWIRRKGKPASREIAPIVVSNHVSYIDPIFYFYELFPTIVASESHDSLPFVGTIIRAMQVIYVNRFSQASRKNAVNEIKRKASCDRFPRVLLFPEGTTTNGRVIISFQLGAFIPGYPIQPVIVRYPHVHFDQSWGDISLAKLMFRMFTQFHNFMEVEYLPVVMPNHNQKETAINFAERGQPSNYMVEMAKVESMFHISSMEAVDFLEKFLSMNPDSSGRVKFLDFLRVLRLKTCALSEKIFGFIDVDRNRSVTFKQFLYASAHIMTLPSFRQACEIAYDECDVEQKGYILAHDLGVIIALAIPDLNENEIHGLFGLFDSKEDGRVSKDDFVHCLRKNPLLVALFSPVLVDKNLLDCSN